MPMPISGCLHLNDEIGANECRSIAHAVFNFSMPPGNPTLSLMGHIVGFHAPIRHSCFYGYQPQSVSIDFTLISSGRHYCIDGIVSLRCGWDNSIVATCTIPGTLTCHSGSFPQQNAGYYYVDLTLLNAYFQPPTTPVSRTIGWMWIPFGGCGSSNTTSFTSHNNFLCVAIQ